MKLRFFTCSYISTLFWKRNLKYLTSYSITMGHFCIMPYVYFCFQSRVLYWFFLNFLAFLKLQSISLKLITKSFDALARYEKYKKLPSEIIWMKSWKKSSWAIFFSYHFTSITNECNASKEQFGKTFFQMVRWPFETIQLW